ncbi:MAG: 3-oxoacyl-ACP reductase [Deltaproteobacteria bacterium CG_4_8_14_3_um_filter_45_9]|nr:MAG: 3-oxoacyl-ACP reductase [Deltaproteobacteria bacterium CG03_land_8_20_14_0_80_45_14]PIX21909.1 MAG: 3-oxoacyl-ACP reductase [Deltaproteobacteria bacterium CG_4_8_14_3_um_filter_45_9]
MQTQETQTALITGGASGIGKAIAEKLSKSDISVYVADINISQAKIVAEDIIQTGRKAKAFHVDISDSSMVDDFFRQLQGQTERLDLLVNAAAILDKTTFIEEMTDEQWRRMISINLDGTFYCCRGAVRWMKEQQSGRIINFSSVAGLTPTPGALHYSVAKGAIIQLTRTLAREVARYNIRINAIAPGYTQTPMLDKMEDKFKEFILKNTPLKRFGTVEEIAGLVAFLATPEADFFTGQIFSPNGGLVI